MADRTILFNRIRNLLSKTVANGATEAEAASAMAAAQRIMDEHDIEMAEAYADGEASIEFGEEVAMELGAKQPTWFVPVSQIIERVFGVELFLKRLRLRHNNRLAAVHVIIFGEAGKIDPACWGLRFLESVFKHLWASYRVRNRVDHTQTASYFEGLKDGFLAKLEEQREEREAWTAFDGLALDGKTGPTTAIAIMERKTREAFEQRHPGMKREVRKYRSDSSSYTCGVKDGRTINLARPLSAPTPETAPRSPLALPGK